MTILAHRPIRPGGQHRPAALRGNVVSAPERLIFDLPNLTKGQQAAITGLKLWHEGKRRNGRWARGSVPGDPDDTSKSGSIGWAKRMAEVGFILDHAFDLIHSVISGSLPLNTAYEQVGSAEPTLSGLRTPFAAQAQEIKAAHADVGRCQRHARAAPARSTADRSGRAARRTGSSSQAQRREPSRAGYRAADSPRRSHQSRSWSRRR